MASGPMMNQRCVSPRAGSINTTTSMMRHSAYDANASDSNMRNGTANAISMMTTPKPSQISWRAKWVPCIATTDTSPTDCDTEYVTAKPMAERHATHITMTQSK